jgi:hypothetical protein
MTTMENAERAERRARQRELADRLKASGALDQIFEQIDAGEVPLGGDDGLLKGMLKAALERGQMVLNVAQRHAAGIQADDHLMFAHIPAPVSVPITIKYSGTFEVTPGSPSPCAGVPITDTLTGTGSHLGLLTATYPHCVNFAAGTFTGTATFEAANGDQLFVALGGSAEDPTRTTNCAVTFTGTITGGTAEGELQGTGTVDLTGSTITAALTGTINKEPEPF